ncbi:MAG: zinc ribbon domain-containing protein [Caldilineaceae bacterium]|nr:zinc ribbon domain-containing protein [Caldilineaceae bacterium]
MIPPDATKQCPYCAETIKAQAIVCRYCGRELVDSARTVAGRPYRQASPQSLFERLMVPVSLGLLVLTMIMVVVLVVSVARLPTPPTQTALSGSSLAAAAEPAKGQGVGSTPTVPVAVTRLEPVASRQGAIVVAANTLAPTHTPVPTDASVPTNTPVPTDASVPTNTPVPTDTPTVLPTETDTPGPTPTETPLPTATSVPTLDPAVCAITNKATYLYGLPSQQVAVVGFLEAGTCVEIIGRTEAGDWYQLNMLQVWVPAQDIDRAPSVQAIALPENPSVAIGTPQSTATVVPTNPPLPTTTLAEVETPTPPTTVPIPAGSSLNVSPTCQEILSAYENSTTAQWRQYRDDHEGKWIQGWTGTIREVSGKWLLGGYPVHIDLPNGCSLYFEVETEAEALSYSPGQEVIIIGQTNLFSVFLGSITIHLDKETVTITRASTSDAPIANATMTPLPIIGGDVMVVNVRWHIFSAENLGNVLTSDNSFIDPLTTPGKFIRVRFEVENRSNDMLTYGGFDLIDSQGREYISSSSAYWMIPDPEDCSFIVNLNPNVPKVCTEIYEVAADATGLKAKVGDLELFGSAESLVELGL